MCRQLAAPAYLSRKEAIDICLDFQKGNTDGVGYAYVKDGQFVVRKYPAPFSKVLHKDKTFLDHMPHDGWTIIHLRAASHGGVKKVNTHPFVVGDWCVAHNGVWHDYALAKACLVGFGGVKLVGETDSEVAANLLAKLGPAGFVDVVSFGGAYLALRLNGDLYTLRTSGDLEYVTRGSRVIIASEFDEETYPQRFEALYGWTRFDKDAALVEKHPTMFVTNSDLETARAVFEDEFATPFEGGFHNSGDWFGEMRPRNVRALPAGKVLGLNPAEHLHEPDLTRHPE